jgi:predicted TIM-barrel fold metal-dependent hydrolase
MHARLGLADPALRSDFGRLYEAYGELFANHSDAERDMLFNSTAQRWYATG